LWIQEGLSPAQDVGQVLPKTNFSFSFAPSATLVAMQEVKQTRQSPVKRPLLHHARPRTTMPPRQTSFTNSAGVTSSSGKVTWICRSW